MRAVIILCALSVVGCFRREPSVEILTPAGGTKITDHQPIALTALVRDTNLDRIEIAVDGVELDESVSVTPSPRDGTCDSCTYHLLWPGLDVREGAHVVSVEAFEPGFSEPIATNDIELVFDDIPELASASPDPDEDLLGVGTVNIQLAVLERGEATVKLAIDGAPVDTKSNASCRGAAGCDFSFTWDTKTLPAGEHLLHFTITDADGHHIEDTRRVKLDDLVKVTSMEVTNTIDHSGALEIEVYVFDDTTNAFLGCAGSAHGLGPVDVSDVRYAVDAQLVNVSDLPLRASELGTHPIRFEVWEDDDDPVCPTPLNPNGNDLVGKGPAKTVAQWKVADAPVAFGNVKELAIVIDRPLTR